MMKKRYSVGDTMRFERKANPRKPLILEGRVSGTLKAYGREFYVVEGARAVSDQLVPKK